MKHKQHLERLDKHRKESFITCKEDCLCWDLDSLLQQLSKKNDEIEEQDKLLLDMLQQSCGDTHGEIDNRSLSIYQEVCDETKNEILTQRRISDIIAELDMLGIINARVISKGRYGRTREISLAIPNSSVNELRETLETSLGL